MKTEQDMIPCKFKLGDKVVYDGVLGEVVSISPVYNYSFWLISLVSVEDEEISCTAKETECRLYDEPLFDEDLQAEKLSDARFSSALIAHQIDAITDKYYGDNSFK